MKEDCDKDNCGMYRNQTTAVEYLDGIGDVEVEERDGRRYFYIDILKGVNVKKFLAKVKGHFAKVKGLFAEKKAAEIAWTKSQKLDDMKNIAQNPHITGVQLDNDSLPETNVERYRKDSRAEKIRGVLVFSVDLGSISLAEAGTLIDDLREKIDKNGVLDRMRAQGIEALFMHHWNHKNTIEYIELP